MGGELAGSGRERRGGFVRSKGGGRRQCGPVGFDKLRFGEGMKETMIGKWESTAVRVPLDVLPVYQEKS